MFKRIVVPPVVLALMMAFVVGMNRSFAAKARAIIRAEMESLRAEIQTLRQALANYEPIEDASEAPAEGVPVEEEAAEDAPVEAESAEPA